MQPACSSSPSSAVDGSHFSHQDHLKATASVLKAVVSSDLSSLRFWMSTYSRTSTPALINQPDSHGWSAIHHCCSARELSREILDSLYCAGAEVSLFTTKEHYTPLHCLAFSSSEDIYDFALHLIRDLRAPLSATDKQGSTCLHIAAEHGSSVELLKAFLECDTTGLIREMRDNNGYVLSCICSGIWNSCLSIVRLHSISLRQSFVKLSVSRPKSFDHNPPCPLRQSAPDFARSRR